MNDLLSAPGLPPPLRVQADMPSRWLDTDTDFDTAAEQLVKAHRADGDARDLPILDLRTWGVIGLDGTFGLKPLAGHHPARPLRGNAFNNLATRLGMPVEFVRDRLPAPLQLATTNFLLASADRPLSVHLRLRGEEVSAIVGAHYARLDPEELVDSVRAALVRHGSLRDVRVRSMATGLTDVLRLVFPSEQRAVKVGDITALGIDISTSSFGRSAVHINSLIWRLICENGMRTTERQGAFSFRHVGDAQRLKDGIAEAIPSALVHANGTMALWQRAVTVMVDNVASQIEALRELTASERSRVEDELKAEANVPELPEHTSVFDLVNGITAAAKQSEPARRLELESLAGDVLRRHVR